MFEIKLLCSDKKLDKVLWALDGLIIRPPEILPVKGGPADPESPEASASYALPRAPGAGHGRTKPAGTTLPEVVLAHLRQQKHPRITFTRLKEAITTVGGHSNSISYVVQYLIKHGHMTGPVEGEYTLKARSNGSAIQETGQNGGTKARNLSTRKGQKPLPFAERIKATVAKRPLGESMPGKAAVHLLKQGLTTPSGKQLQEAVVAVGGGRNSDYYAQVYLQEAGVLSPKGSDGTYLLYAEQLQQQLEAGES